VTDLTGPQISSLLETLPGIAQVLRSPVADAFVGLIRAASGQQPFSLEDAEEIMRYGVRRNLIGAEESERVLIETRDALKAARAASTKKTPGRSKTKAAKVRKPKKAARKASPSPRKKVKSKPVRRAATPRPRSRSAKPQKKK